VKDEEKAQKFSNRLIGCRKAKAWSQEELAEKSGVSLRSIQMWEKGATMPQGSKMRRLSAALAISIPYLLGEEDSAKPPESNVRIEPKGKMYQVPVVSWASAGGGGNFSDLCEYLDEKVETDCPDPNAYSLIVEGDSMEPRLCPGDRVVIAPNIEARNGDMVVARLRESGSALLKLFHQVGKKGELVRLTSYNPAYPALEHPRKDFRFVQPIWGMLRRFRHG
jgi:SOS-response transcriptional repressor LexA